MMNDNIKVCGQVMSTYNYDMFNMVQGNRNLNKCNFSKLVNSMKEEYLEIPIIVNEKYEIIDGQHRFSAAKYLGLPIFFIVVRGYGLSQVKRANIVSSNWVKGDFLEMFVAENKEEYIRFNEIRHKNDVNISSLIKLFAKAQNKQLARVNHEFEDGNFVLDGEDIVLDFLEALEDFNFFKYYKTSQFVSAFMKLYFRPEYEHKKMRNKLKKHSEMLEKKISVDEYLALLCNRIYSYGRTENPIYYSSESKKFHQ